MMTKPISLPNNISDWSKNLLVRMLTINENERIGWD